MYIIKSLNPATSRKPNILPSSTIITCILKQVPFPNRIALLSFSQKYSPLRALVVLGEKCCFILCGFCRRQYLQQIKSTFPSFCYFNVFSGNVNAPVPLLNGFACFQRGQKELHFLPFLELAFVSPVHYLKLWHIIFILFLACALPESNVLYCMLLCNLLKSSFHLHCKQKSICVINDFVIIGTFFFL